MDQASSRGQDEVADDELEVLAVGVLVELPPVEEDEPFAELPPDEPESPDDDSDFAGLLGALLAASEPDDRESVR